MATRARKPQPVREKARAVFRTAILDAAEEAFAEAGFQGAHMQAIAQRAGLSVGSIYNHFGQKEDVLFALVEQRVDELLDAFRPVKDDPKDFATMLAVRLERVLAYRERHAAFFKLAVDLGILGDAPPDARHALGGRALPQAAVRMRRAWLDIVDEGIAAKALAPLDRELLAALLKSTLRTVARATRDSGSRQSPGEIARVMVDVFLHGVSRRKTR